LVVEEVVLSIHLLRKAHIDTASFNLSVAFEQASSFAVKHTQLHDALVVEEELLSTVGLKTGCWIRLHETNLNADPFEVIIIGNLGCLHQLLHRNVCRDIGFGLTRHRFCVNELVFRR